MNPGVVVSPTPSQLGIQLNMDPPKQSPAYTSLLGYNSAKPNLPRQTTVGQLSDHTVISGVAFAGQNRDDWDDLLQPVSAHVWRRMYVTYGHRFCRNRSRTCQIQSRAHMPFGFGTRWKWPMIRSVDIRARR